MRKSFKIALGAFAVIVAFCLCAGTAFLRFPLWFADQDIRLHLRHQHVQSLYRQVDGYTIHYFEAFPPDGSAGTPLVLIHGLGARGEDWSAMIPSLAAHGFHVYVPDLLGYGRSSRPDVDYSISLQEKTVVNFMQTLGLTHADVGGWSMGGWVALKLTVDHPELVDRLVVYDAAGIYFPAPYNASLFTPTDTAGLHRLIDMLTPDPKPLPGFAARAAIRKLQANAWILDRSVDSMIGGRDLLDFELYRIHVPVLIVWGGQDQLIPLPVGESMHRKIPGSSLFVVQGCGHLAPAECSKPILRATVRFLSANPPPRPFERSVPKP